MNRKTSGGFWRKRKVEVPTSVGGHKGRQCFLFKYLGVETKKAGAMRHLYLHLTPLQACHAEQREAESKEKKRRKTVRLPCMCLV